MLWLGLGFAALCHYWDKLHHFLLQLGLDYARLQFSAVIGIGFRKFLLCSIVDATGAPCSSSPRTHPPTASQYLSVNCGTGSIGYHDLTQLGTLIRHKPVNYVGRWFAQNRSTSTTSNFIHADDDDRGGELDTNQINTCSLKRETTECVYFYGGVRLSQNWYDLLHSFLNPLSMMGNHQHGISQVATLASVSLL